ncbi:MAG: GNAT family N-acetyltransferase [Clostridiales bacterium]|jgi:ribosomal protein S18 acetylase RimI-like enzyme|nr:GNAT family N-acetyltransferase [Clostridiales bacterium]MDR2749734.1 GNAT family N-acetyltransferase [Clostridiales bacterium]
MDYLKASDLPFDAREQISRIFSDGFYQWLRYFSKDKAKLARAFEHSFKLPLFWVAVDGNAIASIAACTDGITSPVSLDRHELQRHLGFVRGMIAHKMLKPYLQEHKYPFTLTAGTGSVEFVATAEKYRGKGIAFNLVAHIMERCGHAEYVLEVADTNATAVRLYERLGFKEFKRVPEKNPKQSGLNFYVYMKATGKAT